MKGKKLIILGIVVALLSSCTVASDVDYSDVDEAKKAMNTATIIQIKGDLENVNQAGDILADEKVAGFLQESGMLDSRWTVSIGEDEWFYLKYVTDEPINNVDGVVSSTTYGYYDSKDNCLGYAQQQYLEDINDEPTHYWIFMDADGNEKDYYASEDCHILYDVDGNEIGKGSADRDGFWGIGKKCLVQIEMKEDTDVQVDFMDKLAIYLRLYKELDDSYRD